MLRQLLFTLLSLPTFLASSAMLEAGEDAEVIFAGDFGITIIGTIITHNNNDVVLIKFKETDKVKAHRVGFTLYKKYAIQEITGNYLLVAYAEGSSAKLMRIYKDGFVGPTKPVKEAAANTAPSNDSFSEDGFDRGKGKIEMTESYRDKMIMQELPKILMQASAEPVLENGQIVGFMLDQIEPNSIYSKAGLQNGDVVTSINDISLHDVTATIKLLHSLKTAKEISLDLNRNGQVTPVQIKVK